jgi:arginyl-tRNA synthetase
MIRKWLSQQMTQLIERTYSVTDVVPVVDVPNHSGYGDFSSNVAFGLAKILKKSPMHIAEQLCTQGNQEFQNTIIFSSVNGFVNLKLADSLLWQDLSRWDPEIIETVASPQRILLEYVSANPTGPLHIGHGRWAVIGNCLSNLLKSVGHTVHSEFYVNDAGNQIALLRESVAAVQAGTPIPEGGYFGSYIKAITAADPVEALRASQEDTLKRMGVTFDQWFSETTLHKSGQVGAVINQLRALGVVYDQDDAVWFRSTDFGDDKDRVLVKNDGSYTYFAVDCAYHFDKLQRAGDRLINIWGADHHGYVARVKAIVSALATNGIAPEFTVIIGQLVTLLKDGEPVRMSKRTGEMVTLDEIIDDIGPDATRFFLAMKSSDSTIEFDLEVAKKKSNENPVFYVQYAHARICAIYRKLDQLAPSTAELVALNEAERNLIIGCLQFQDEIHYAASQLAPHRVVHYLIMLAGLIHAMYEASPIATAETQLQTQRLYVLSKAQSCLANGLRLLGVSAPQAM